MSEQAKQPESTEENETHGASDSAMAKQERSKKDYDLDFSPDTYWGGFEELSSSVLGEARRKILEVAAANHELDQLPREFFSSALDDDNRRAWGAIHPGLMGGEYLPDLEKGEVEIARVVFASLMRDVISVRARRSGGLIHYSIVDEFDGVFNLEHEWSESPLPLRDLVKLIDDVEEEDWSTSDVSEVQMPFRALVFSVQQDGGCPRERGEGSFEVTSSFYPQLEQWYLDELEKWIVYQEKLDDPETEFDYIGSIGDGDVLICQVQCLDRMGDVLACLADGKIEEAEEWLELLRGDDSDFGLPLTETHGKKARKALTWALKKLRTGRGKSLDTVVTEVNTARAVLQEHVRLSIIEMAHQAERGTA